MEKGLGFTSKFITIGYMLALLTSMAGMEIFSVLLFLFTLSMLIAKKYAFSFDKPTVIIILGFVTIHVLSILFSPYIELNQFVEYIRKVRWIVFLFLIPIFIKYNFEFMERYGAKILLTIFLIISVYSIIQTFTGIDIFRSKSYYFYKTLETITVWRAKGFFTNTMTFSHIWSMVLLIFLPFLTDKKYSSKLLKIAFATGCIALVFSFTRGAWLAFLVSALIGLYFLYPKKRIPIYGSVGIVIMVLLFIPFVQERILSIFNSEDLSRLHRVNIWRANFSMFLDNIWFGVGLQQNMDLTPSYFQKLGIEQDFYGHAHNNYFQYLATTGLVGFLGFLGFMLYFLKITIHLFKKYAATKSATYYLVLGLLLAQVFFHLSGLTEAVVIDAEILHSFTMILSMVLFLNYRDKICV